MKAQVCIAWLVVLFTGFSLSANAQKHPAHLQKRETITVQGGSCHSCKKMIEKAARSAGAYYAEWDMRSKALTVAYDIQNANSEKIQQRVARAGFDTPLVKAHPSSYQQLETCCRYDRKNTGAAISSGDTPQRASASGL
jgi:periplasmic mercuric ion binding protein